METDLVQMQVHYARGREAGRLDEPLGQVELERTKELVLRALPPPLGMSPHLLATARCP